MVEFWFCGTFHWKLYYSSKKISLDKIFWDVILTLIKYSIPEWLYWSNNSLLIFSVYLLIYLVTHSCKCKVSVWDTLTTYQLKFNYYEGTVFQLYFRGTIREHDTVYNVWVWWWLWNQRLPGALLWNRVETVCQRLFWFSINNQLSLSKRFRCWALTVNGGKPEMTSLGIIL